MILFPFNIGIWYHIEYLYLSLVAAWQISPVIYMTNYRWKWEVAVTIHLADANESSVVFWCKHVVINE